MDGQTSAGASPDRERESRILGWCNDYGRATRRTIGMRSTRVPGHECAVVSLDGFSPRYFNDAGEPTDAVIVSAESWEAVESKLGPVPDRVPRVDLGGTWQKIGGTWGIRVSATDVEPGDRVVVRTRAGKVSTETVACVVLREASQVTCTIVASEKPANDASTGGGGRYYAGRSVRTRFNSGAEVYTNARGRCIDAPCCGCCT